MPVPTVERNFTLESVSEVDGCSKMLNINSNIIGAVKMAKDEFGGVGVVRVYRSLVMCIVYVFGGVIFVCAS